MEQYIWIVIFIIALVAEIFTVNLVSIWFVVGALAAQIAKWLGAGTGLQAFLFVLTSVLLLVFIYPKVRKTIGGKKTALNADRIIGMEALVTEPISALQETGAVKVDGKVWSARSEDRQDIPEGAVVEIVSIEGAHVTVKQKEP